MAAHRYWRIQVTKSGNFSSIGEIQLRDTPGGSNRIGSGTPSANSAFSGFAATSAVDGNTATDWCSSGADTTPNWWQYDFGSGNAFDIVEVVITATTNGDAQYTPTDFTLAYSDNGTTWTTLYRFHRSAAWTSGASQTFTVTLGSGFTHSSWRINVTATALNTFVEIAELALRATSGGSNILLSGSPNAYASTVFSGSTPDKVYDGSNSTAWSTSSGATLPQWWAVDLGTTSDVQEVAITSHTTDNIGYLPTAFDLQYSDDGGINWTTKQSFTASGWSTAQTKTFTSLTHVTWDSGNKSTFCTLTGGNLIATSSAGTVGVFATSGQSAGKYYFEYTQTGAVGVTTDAFGLALNNASVLTLSGGAAQLLFTSATAVSVVVNGTAPISAATYGAVTTGAGTVFGVALDLDNQQIWFRVGAAANWNGSATANPATNTGGVNIAAIGGKGMSLIPHLTLANSSHSVTANFGDTAFSGTVPTGFTAGFPTGGANNALITQVGAEVWRAAPSNAQFTQIGAEVWRSVATGVAVTTTPQPIVMMLC